MNRRRVAIASLGVLLASTVAALADPAPSTLEPPPGTLFPGQSMLIDDGTCPTGQIKKIMGGNLTKTSRIRTCVPRH